MHQPPWEYIIYGDYLARDNPLLFSPKNYDKWGRLQLPTGLYRMEHLMAGKAKPKAKAQYENSLQWVKGELSDGDVSAIEGWEINDGQLLACLMELEVLGHTVSGKAASDGDGYTHFAIGVGDECINVGLGMSGYGSTPRDAVVALCYKHFIKYSGEWPRTDTGSKRRFR